MAPAEEASGSRDGETEASPIQAERKNAMTTNSERKTSLQAANDTGPAKASHADIVRIRQEIAAAAFAQTPRGKRLLAARR